MATCLLHDPPLEIADSRDGCWMFKHLADAHGEGQPDQWPDGSPIVYDQAVKIGDFLAEAGQ
jgi:hypothetical protein